MSYWLGDYQFEEEYNNDVRYANSVIKRFAGNLSSSSDSDWFMIDNSNRSNWSVTFDPTNYQLGGWSLSVYSNSLNLISNQNIYHSDKEGDMPHDFNIYDMYPGIYYINIASITPYKGDVYKVNITEEVISVPTINTPNEISISEGNTDFVVVPIDLTLSAKSTGSVVVHYSVRSGTANVGTYYNADVVGSNSGNIIFDAGQITATLSNVSIWSDTTIENDEYFWIDFDDVVIGDYLFSNGSEITSVKVNILNDDVDVSVPTATITLSDSNLIAGETAQVSIQFNEAITGFTSSDVRVENASITNLTSNDNINWTALLTPNNNVFDATNTFSIQANALTDQNGNSNQSITSINYIVDTRAETSLTNTTSYLSALGITVQVAKDFIMSNLANPRLIFDTADQFDINNQMLADIVGVQRTDVVGFWTSLGYDHSLLG